ncbi:hypothetical protein D3OALGA1CA_424 [Olavius algarvensis associated proteobacterium Delta 3]|nr:hypothetical protein D3OALGA1CA_424 [Olavius algarvensis associated proteobacterium Delta 3]CAB5114041.1 hypothetical protein D3OALGB2SA_2566 [Olavius algarvensis associated proteobacterium Delta 3]
MSEIRHDASATIGARAFHKETGVAEQQRTIENEFVQKFVDPDTGRVYPDYLVQRPCPTCGHQGEGQVAFFKNGFDHTRCSCGMLYVSKILKEEYLNLVYADENYEAETHRSFRTEPRKHFIEAIYSDGLKLLKTAGFTDGALLDVGCSSGLFMENAIYAGFSAIGIEPSDYAVRLAGGFGLDVVQGYFTGDRFPVDAFRVVTLWDVLEHCADPAEILTAAYHVLAPGGAIFIQVPNALGLAPRIMRQDCNMFTGFGHINLFGPESARSILAKIGFVDVRMQSVISEISVVNNYIDYHDPYLGPSLKKDDFLGLIDAGGILDRLLGYKLQVIGIKSHG